MQAIENHMVLGQTYDAYWGSDETAQMEECHNCSGTGKILLDCECGNSPEYGDVICHICGRPINFEPCYKCKGEGEIEK